MISKIYFFLFLIAFSTPLIAEEPILTTKFYGFVRNDFFYNSRKNEESGDGTFNFYPKPIELTNMNATPAFQPEHEQPNIHVVGALNPPPSDEELQSYYDEEDEEETKL